MKEEISGRDKKSKERIEVRRKRREAKRRRVGKGGERREMRVLERMRKVS
jgi:hypothetical protein